ncbi:hypothetical protein OY671_011675, partial [Metschnikowia pulcherrima]
ARGSMVYPMGGTIDGRQGDHVSSAPPFIITDDESDQLTDRSAGAIDAAIAGVTAIADDPVPAPLEGFEQQFLERQRVHGAQPRIVERGGSIVVAPPQSFAHGPSSPSSPAVTNGHAIASIQKHQQGGADNCQQQNNIHWFLLSLMPAAMAGSTMFGSGS